MTTAETENANFDPYQQSAQQLFALLGADQPPDAETRFYQVAWNETSPTAIDNITTMTASPTGALQEEQWGAFYRAQFRLAETTETGVTTERFIWCRTPPLRPGEPIPLDREVLLGNRGYAELSQESVVRMLAGRTRTIDDCVSLIRITNQHGVEATGILTHLVNSFISSFAHNLRAQAEAAVDGDLGQDKMFALMHELELLGSELPATTQGHMVTQLMRVVHGKALPQVPNAAADNAAAILDTAFKTGVIPDEPRTTDRVLGNKRVYAYPFATELAHAKLEAEPDYGTRERIFGKQRIWFVGDYIGTMLDRATGLHNQIDNILVNCSLRFPGIDEDHLYLFIGRLGQLFSERLGTAAPLRPITLGAVGPAFAHLLSQATGGEQAGEEQIELNRKSVELVTAVLRPIILRRLGQDAIAAEQEET